MKRKLIGLLILATVAATTASLGTAQTSPGAPDRVKTPLKGGAKVRADAATLKPLFPDGLAAQFLNAATSEKAVPMVPSRPLVFNKTTRDWRTMEEAQKLPDHERPNYREELCDESQFYETKYGSPLVYARVLEIAGTYGLTMENDGATPAVMDFGYGTIGHLIVMGALGIETVGVDTDIYLWKLYAPERAAGRVQCLDPSKSVALNLFNGQWPAEPTLVEQVRAVRPGGFDLITSKNTLKNGYLHPARQVDEKKLVKLGVSDEAFVDAAFGSLKPGGLLVIYNISPRLSREDEPYKPWSDGRSPFPREMMEKAGFEVLAFDQNDDAKAEAIFKALAYPVTDIKGEKDLFALYTVCRRPVR